MKLYDIAMKDVYNFVLIAFLYVWAIKAYLSILSQYSMWADERKVRIKLALSKD